MSRCIRCVWDCLLIDRLDRGSFHDENTGIAVRKSYDIRDGRDLLSLYTVHVSNCPRAVKNEETNVT